MMRLVPIFVLLVVALPAQPPRFSPDLGRVVATSNYGDLLAAEFYRAIASRYGRDPGKKIILEQLIQVELVAGQITQEKISIDPELVTRKISKFRTEASTQGKSLEQRLKEMNLSLETLRYFTWIGLGRRMLTAKALQCPLTEVTPSQERLWLADQLQKSKIEKCLDRLEEGTAAKINSHPISTELYGWVLAASLNAKKQNYRNLIINSVISGRRIRELARMAEINVTAEDRKTEIARRRANIKKDPRYHGASLDQLLLKTRGYSVKLLCKSRPFNDHIMLNKLIDKRWPGEKQVAYLKKNLAQYLNHFGESRHLLHMLLPCKNEQEALKRTESLRGKIKSPTTFKLFAAYSTPKKNVKRSGCDLGFVHRIEKGVPQSLLDEAFKLESGKVGGPYSTEKGFHLLMVTEIKPTPPEDQLLVHVLRDLRQEFLRELIKKAEIKIQGEAAEDKGKK